MKIGPAPTCRLRSDTSTSRIHAIDPAYPVNVRFFDNVLNAVPGVKCKLNRQITLFSLLAILISMIGVFGLVIFDTQYRRKEIGITKDYSARRSAKSAMFNRTYVRMSLPSAS